MQEQTKKPKRRVQVPKLAVSKRFGKYKSEERKEERVALVKQSGLQSITRKWSEWTAKCETQYGYECWGIDPGGTEKYEMALELLRHIKYTSEDVGNFCLMLKGYDDGHVFMEIKAGDFLSALVEQGYDRHYRLDISQLEFELDCLAGFNSKNIFIIGGVGDHLGSEMKKGNIFVAGYALDWVGGGMYSGNIFIEGNVGERAGSGLNGGFLFILKNARNEVGYEMTGGMIRIKGNVGLGVGEGMTGGEIHIEGEIGSIGDVIQGKIYHKGKLIVDK